MNNNVHASIQTKTWQIYQSILIMPTQKAKFVGPTWAHMGPVGPRWAHVGPMNLAIRAEWRRGKQIYLFTLKIWIYLNKMTCGSTNRKYPLWYWERFHIRYLESMIFLIMEIRRFTTTLLCRNVCWPDVDGRPSGQNDVLCMWREYVLCLNTEKAEM